MGNSLQGTKLSPFIMVIFGGTGDLARRKLYPALYSLFRDDLVPPRFAMVALGRKEKSQEIFRKEVYEAIEEFSELEVQEGNDWGYFSEHLYYRQLDVGEPSQYLQLREFLAALDDRYGTRGNRVYYLAVAPELFQPIVKELHEKGMAENKGQAFQRVVIEKPFGKDLNSARSLNQSITEAFEEQHIFRIDHYLGKEMLQNIMVIRFANTLFEPVWNNKYIDHVQINSSETVGVEDRGDYYEKSGALLDMVQNHMMQLLTMIAMEPPASLDTDSIRDEKVKLLKSLVQLTEEQIRTEVIRGQYGQGISGKKEVPAYREEEKVDPKSTTETFIALKAQVENFRWADVPFYLRTGKRMPVKSTEIIIQFKALPGILYFKEHGELEPNLLIIRIQPREGVYLQFNAKKPGTKNFIIPVQMDFCQNCLVEANSPEAYERLLYDVIRGDSTLFTRWDEVEYAWKYVDKIARVWSEIEPLFPNYPAGTRGPEAAERLLAKDGRKWWNI